MSAGSITDVPGIHVGHASRLGDGYRTGVSVIVPPPGTLAAVDVRGGAPCTIQTDALRGGAVGAHPQAILFTGGSGLGLASVAGVHRWCVEQGLGFPIGPATDQIVPVVAGAAIFDLGRGGRLDAVPDADLAHTAATDSQGPEGVLPRRGPIGAGTGALVDDERGRGGVGGASLTLDLDGVEAVIGALAVVNAYGRPDVPSAPYDGPRIDDALANTTLIALATSASVERALLERLAVLAHDGLARAISPVHTLADGDVVFALSTGAVPLPPEGHGFADLRRWRRAQMALQEAAATVSAEAVRDAVRASVEAESAQ